MRCSLTKLFFISITYILCMIGQGLFIFLNFNQKTTLTLVIPFLIFNTIMCSYCCSFNLLQWTPTESYLNKFLLFLSMIFLVYNQIEVILFIDFENLSLLIILIAQLFSCYVSFVTLLVCIWHQQQIQCVSNFYDLFL